ncbi:3-dehydroquinate synthase [Sinanaerobacter chloroacetimidivorans]|jgi:3-dehydroquinate synthase|uniref:3-dehydroquinate synthase n=1 Tax=Sinanaerobacter chloroacetimidivorans TaxID=2818044 RepID=A0A8J8B5A2_9FIRM|nr:3-dehydroquinate synthase [Sinanaerobacter chloroacetimidivorans]MBR0600145.1 3-dehydroquinate synthase [Sinanaerobacter chloroacetimidivorans]
MKYNLTINMKTGKYPVLIESGLFSSIGNLLGQHFPGKKLAVITDEHIWKTYGDFLGKQLNASHCQWDVLILPPGESSKSFDALAQIYKKLLSFQITRDDVIISLGGGIIGDVSGFAAATFLRGVYFVQIPTTLIGQVDSSIGGKNAINLPEGKNMVGTFYQPDYVFIDPDFVKTLSDFHMADGMAEIIKYACVADAELFSDLFRMSSYRDTDLIESIIYRCCLIKKQIIEQDEKDNGIRMLSNFGHTFGHAIEYLYPDGTYGHGQAVAMGMQIITEKSEAMGLTAINTSAMLKEILSEYNLPSALPEGIDKELLIQSALRDKKRRGNKINLVLLEKIGIGYIHPIEKTEIKNFI